jgi:hypothetical protein
VKTFATMPGMNTSLDEARRWVDENAPDGVICPCCKQVAKIYKRKLNRAMAYSLICIYRLRDEAGECGWIDVPRLLAKYGLVSVLRSREYQKLCYWGLLEAVGEKREDGGKAGKYRLTNQGLLFVANKLALPRYVSLYNGAVIDVDATEKVTIREALGDRFNYEELMAARGTQSEGMDARGS